MVMSTAQTANDQARQILANLGLQGEGIYRGAGLSLESQLAYHIAQRRPYRAFTGEGQLVVYDGKGNVSVSSTNQHAFH